MNALLCLLLAAVHALPPFVGTWKTTTANEIIYLPPDNINILIDYGDGSPAVNTSLVGGASTHTYVVPGFYTISIVGSITAWNFALYPYSRENLVSIHSWGGFTLHSVGSYFEGCSNLTTINATDQPVIPASASMYRMFDGCSSLNSPIHWNTSNVTNMDAVFVGATSFNSPITLDTSQVTTMRMMFFRAEEFNQPVEFDTSKTLDMSFMFWHAIKFNQSVNFDTSAVTSMLAMFLDARDFNQPVPFDTSEVTNMGSMFDGARSFNQPLDFNTSKVTWMPNMFHSADSFNQPLNFDTREVTRLDFMFSEAKAFNQSLNFSTSKVTMIGNMFYNATNFNSPIFFDDMSEVQYLDGMFDGAESFNQPLNWSTTKAISMTNMFRNALSFNSPLYLDTTNVISMGGMFKNAPAFKQSINFNVSAVQDASEMFFQSNISDCYHRDLSMWNFNNVSQCSNFCECCDLPIFQNCTPCDVLTSAMGRQVCYCPYGEINVTSNQCAGVPCIGPAYSGKAAQCECGSGYFGTVSYLENITLGCTAILCVGPSYTGNPASCRCGSGFAGNVAYAGNTTTGCYPANGTYILFPYSDDINSTTVNVSDVQVVVGRDIAYGSNGTVEVKLEPPSGLAVSRIVTINFFDMFSREKNISGLGNPIRFLIPFQTGAADPFAVCLGRAPALVVPSCKWYDSLSGSWSTSGCETNLSSTYVTCSCFHLTDFALVLPEANRVPLRQLFELTPHNISQNPDGLITILVVLGQFALLLVFSINRDRRERDRSKKIVEKFEAAFKRDATLKFTSKWWRRLKAGLQSHHTLGAVIFRKTGTSFTSVDRTFVTLFLMFVLLSMSASFHSRDSSLFSRAGVMLYTVLVSLVPTQVLMHLFTHTGEMGPWEKWQMDKKLKSASTWRCLRYRFPLWCRWVWYGLVLGCVLGMILYVLSIALMFDQNPEHFCLGRTTASWLIDFIGPYLISVFIVEPLKILGILAMRDAVHNMATNVTRTQVDVGEREATQTSTVEVSDSRSV